jgi:epoxyqueuosine reductase QueG
MPEKETVERARKDARQGKAPSTQAGEFVREEMHHIREGKHGARSTKQAIAIGLSKARQAGVELAPPKKGRARARTRKQAARDYRKGQQQRASKPSSTRSRAVLRRLKQEPHAAASHRALATQAKKAARKRSRHERVEAAKRAARTRRSHRE